MENKTSNLADAANCTKPVLAAGFSLIDHCKCKCGQWVSPSEAVDETQILYDDKRENVIGFRCWKCDEWIAFPKTCR